MRELTSSMRPVPPDTRPIVPGQRLANLDILRALAAMRGEDLSALTTSVDQHRKRVGGFLDVFNGLAQRLPNVHVLDPESCLADAEGVIKPQRDGVVLYRDGNHLTTSGSMLLKSAFIDTLRRQPEESATNGNDKSQDG